MAAPPGPGPIVTTLYDEANSYGHLTLVEREWIDPEERIVRTATFVSAAGEHCQWVYDSIDGSVSGSFPSGSIVWPPESASVWTVSISSGGQTWSIPVDVAEGQLLYATDEAAFEQAVAALIPGSAAVGRAAWDFSTAQGLLAEASDGSFVVTAQRVSLWCALSAVGLVASYGAFVTCAVGALPMCLLGIAGHTTAVIGFARNCS